MWNFFQRRMFRWQLGRYRTRIEGLLTPSASTRTEWRERLLLNVSGRLNIRWQARDIHPWDCDLPLERRQAVFAEQSLADTEAAIGRLFKGLPSVDVIDLSVLEPSSGTIIIAGTVNRGCLAGVQRLASVRMRLIELGVRYRLNGTQLEALGNAEDGSDGPPAAGTGRVNGSDRQCSVARP